VIDPNVWISGLIKPSGTAAQVIRAAITDRIVVVVNQHLLDELAAVLMRPKFRRWISVDDATDFIKTLAAKSEFYPDPGQSSARTRDPSDDYLVALAEAANAIIVTGDADLLEADLDLPSITPRALLEHF